MSGKCFLNIRLNWILVAEPQACRAFLGIGSKYSQPAVSRADFPFLFSPKAWVCEHGKPFPEGTEDAPGRSQGVVGYGDIRPSLCPKEPEAYPALSLFLMLFTCTTAIDLGSSWPTCSKTLGWYIRICDRACGLGKNMVCLSGVLDFRASVYA